MAKQHEFVALASGRKGEVTKAVTEIYHKLQKPELFDGMQRTYKPRAEDGERQPSESKHPQHSVKEIVDQAVQKWGDLFDMSLTVDAGNTMAKADIVVGDKTLAVGIPVPTLLFLEKQLTDVKSLIEKIPTPDPAEKWTDDPTIGMLATQPVETVRTKKVQKSLVLISPTPEHPGQAQMITEDELVGYWKTIKYTTKMPANFKSAMLERVERLRDAVKVAKERANNIEVAPCKMGEALLGFVFKELVAKK